MKIEKDGFDFVFDAKKCSECDGNCCIGESGYIWINPQESKALSEHLGISLQELQEKYLTKIKYKYSIKEKKVSENNYACIFFDLEKKQCSVYEYRPVQCRTFPFWDYYKTKPEEVKEECPAIKLI
jgi:Fe-S-cluster containining protein